MKTKCKKVLDEILYICFEEDHEELNKELVSIKSALDEESTEDDCINLIEEILASIYLYAEEFDATVYEQIEEMYRDLVED